MNLSPEGNRKMPQCTASKHPSLGKEGEQEKHHHDSGPASFCEWVLCASEPFPERCSGYGQMWIHRFLLKLGTRNCRPIWSIYRVTHKFLSHPQPVVWSKSVTRKKFTTKGLCVCNKTLLNKWIIMTIPRIKIMSRSAQESTLNGVTQKARTKELKATMQLLAISQWNCDIPQ